MSPRFCSLQLTLGVTEACTEARCPFWEDGGAVLPEGCAVERLDLAREPQLAGYLMDVRRGLETARDREHASAARREFAQRLGRDV